MNGAQRRVVKAALRCVNDAPSPDARHREPLPRYRAARPCALCASLKENQDRECTPTLVVYAFALEFRNSIFRFLNALQYVGTKELGQGIIISSFPFLLHNREAHPEFLDLLRTFSHDGLMHASFLRLTMFKGAIDLSPRRLTARGSGRTYQHIGATVRQRMEECVIGCADRATQLRFPRPSGIPSSGQLLSDCKQMMRIQRENSSWSG